MITLSRECSTAFLLVLVVSFVALNKSEAYAAADDVSCEEVLSNDTFRDALTRNDERDFGVFAHDREGYLLIGLRCEKAVLDDYFAENGWSVGEPRMRPDTGPFGPFGPPSNRYYYDTKFSYLQCRDKPFWQFWVRRCFNSISFSTFEGVITHISAGGIK